MTAERSPLPVCFAVIFSNQRNQIDDDGYAETATRIEELAASMPGYLGFESARSEGGFGISVSYWESEEAIANWKSRSEHLEAQRHGQTEWYSDYIVRVAKVTRAYAMKKKQETD